jgi:DNA-directed RNA polymerase subunit beta'
VVKIGDNLGTKNGQTLSEPLTQLVLNTFHSGGIAGTGKKAGYERIQELFAKDIVKGRSVLSTVSGRVTNITPSGLGGHNVYVDGVKHVTPPHQTLLVKKGQMVKRGDQLNMGPISPQDMLKHKGLESLQNYMTDELKEAYGGQEVHIDRKTFESVVKSVTGNTRVLNNVNGAPWLPGQVIPYNVAEDYNSNLKKGETKLEHAPEIKGLKNIPISRENWIAQLGVTDLKEAVIKGASQGWGSDLKGYHPIPAYAYGATFGDGKDGRY